ncbi:MAG: alpha/beta hydrolase [Clostridia bacterium]|nr:alpha/beta hydrolase [Clostridia bacterium]
MDVSGVSFLQKGTGKDLVFLHGYLSSKEAFAAQTAYFSRFYRVTAIDFLGQGKSPPLTEPYSVDDYAAWTEQVLSALNVENPHVIAHSFGCRVLIKMAKRGRQVFDRIVLTGPAGVVFPRGLGYRYKVGAYRLVRKIAPHFAEKNFGSTEYRTLSPVMKESYKKIVNEDLRATAACLSNAVLIIEGERDEVTPMKEAQAYCDVMKNARLERIDGGHFAFAENPVAFNILVEEFLQNA